MRYWLLAARVLYSVFEIMIQTLKIVDRKSKKPVAVPIRVSAG
jgi:hypothetical protein